VNCVIEDGCNTTDSKGSARSVDSVTVPVDAGLYSSSAGDTPARAALRPATGIDWAASATTTPAAAFANYSTAGHVAVAVEDPIYVNRLRRGRDGIL
jgi:hypothetical protein